MPHAHTRERGVVSDGSAAALGRPQRLRGEQHIAEKQHCRGGDLELLEAPGDPRKANAWGVKGRGGLNVRVAPLGAAGPPSTAALDLGRRHKGVRVLLQAVGMGCREFPTCLPLLSCLHFKHISGTTGAAGPAPLPWKEVTRVSGRRQRRTARGSLSTPLSEKPAQAEGVMQWAFKILHKNTAAFQKLPPSHPGYPEARSGLWRCLCGEVWLLPAVMTQMPLDLCLSREYHLKVSLIFFFKRI